MLVQKSEFKVIVDSHGSSMYDGGVILASSVTFLDPAVVYNLCGPLMDGSVVAAGQFNGMAVEAYVILLTYSCLTAALSRPGSFVTCRSQQDASMTWLGQR